MPARLLASAANAGAAAETTAAAMAAQAAFATARRRRTNFIGWASLAPVPRSLHFTSRRRDGLDCNCMDEPQQPPPRAFTQGVGLVFQTVGVTLFLVMFFTCCGSSLL